MGVSVVYGRERVVIMLRLDGFYLVLVIVYLIFLSGCCEPYEQPQPARPKQVSGWKDSHFSGVHSVAELVLKEEESSENGRIGVKVVSISQLEKCVKSFSEPKPHEAVLRIYRAPINKYYLRVPLVAVLRA